MERSEEENNQGVIHQFMNITGCNRNLSENILASHNDNLERALDYFYGPTDDQPPGPSNVIDVDAADQMSAEDLKGLEVSVVSWNIDGLDTHNRASRFQACYYVLKRISADFIFLQEVVNEVREPCFSRLENTYNIYFSDTNALYYTAILVCKQFDVKSHQVIHFKNSGMGRTLQILEGRLGPLKVFLLNTHLESMAEFGAIRREQFRECMMKINEIIAANPGCLLYFGGDLNIRDKEVVQESSHIPPNVADAWMAAGGKINTKYTFDMTINDNKALGRARCRFDRIYFYGPLEIASFELQGQQRIRTSLCFPSDHFAMLSEDNTVALSLSDDENDDVKGHPPPIISPFAAPDTPSLLDDLDEPEETAPSKLMLSNPEPTPNVEVKDNAASIANTLGASSTVSSYSSLPRSASPPPAQDTNHVLNVSVRDFEKRGDGMNAYIVYKIVTTSENVPGYSDRTTEVWRRFSDFLGLRDKLVEKHQVRGIVVPPAPEKSIAVMTKAKTAGDVNQTGDLPAKRARQLERFLCRIVQHQKMRCDCDVRDFLTFPGDLPHSSQTVALSGAGVKRMFNKFTDVFNKMAFHMEEGDRWFEQALSQVEELDDSLKKVLNLAEHLAGTRKELANGQESMSRALSMLASCEESTSLARALSHLTETEEGVAMLWAKQAEQDTIKFTEALSEYVGLLSSLKDVFHERVRLWQKWQDSQQILHKKRENKSRMELTGKLDRANALKNEIEETAKKMDQQEQEFMELSRVIREEISRFETQRRTDMRKIFIEYMESLVHTHTEMLKLWEKFAPESAAIIV